MCTNDKVLNLMNLSDCRLVIFAVGTNDVSNTVWDHYRRPSKRMDINDNRNRDTLIP